MESEMKYVYEVYQHRGFSKAAEALHITQPALSIAVQKLESRIGMPLFDRTAKPMVLTEAGKLYIQKYEEISALETELNDQINDLSSLEKGSLRIGGTHQFNAYILPPVLAEFMETYPGIDVHLLETEAQYLLDELYQHHIDLTFNSDPKPTDSFRRYPCFSDMILLALPKALYDSKNMPDCYLSVLDVLNKKHLNPDCPAISLESFADVPYILLSPGNNLYERCMNFFTEFHVNPRIRMQVSQLVTAWHLSQTGLAATFVSPSLISENTQDMLFYKIDSPDAVRIFDMTMSDRHYVSNAMKAFQAIFRKHYPFE